MTDRLIRRAFTALACAALGFASVPAAVASEPLACGDVLLTDTLLAADLTCGAGDGLVLGAPGITLDLNGHSITGSGIGNSAGGVRVPPGINGTTITNGHIAGFTEGVVVDSSAWTTVAGLDVSDTLRGINLANASWSTIARNTVANSALDGIRVDGWGSMDNQVTRNIVTDSDFIALTVSNGARGTEVSRNTVTTADLGIAVFAYAEATKVMLNMVEGTTEVGITVHYGPDLTRVQRNDVTAGSGIGIRIGQSGTPVTSSTLVDWNSVSGFGADASIVVADDAAAGTTLFRNIVA
jgi:parallel beta-helix repeat protein